MRSMLLAASLLFACAQHAFQPTMVTNPITNTQTYSFLSLGDSYTIGESVPETARWSVQLADLLRKEGVDIASPDIIAQTGWTTAELQEAIRASNNQKTYGLVSLLIGVNNQYRGQRLDRYRTEFNELLQTAIHFAGNKAAHVIVLSIPDWGASPFASGQNRARIAQEIDQFNAVAKDECQKADVAFVDITPITRTAARDSSQFAADGLHYSARQMRLWAEKALPIAKTLAKSK